MVIRPVLLALGGAVGAFLIGCALLLLWQNSGLRADNAALNKDNGLMRTANAAQNATIRELRVGAARVDKIVGEWGHDRENLSEGREELRAAVKELSRVNEAFSAWFGSLLPGAVRAGGGLLGPRGNSTRAADSQSLSPGRPDSARLGP